MNAQTARKAIQATLFAAAVLWMCGIAVAAKAQSSPRPAVTIRFSLPFEAYWGTKVLSPGKYKMYIDNSHPAALVEAENGNSAFFTPIPITNRGQKGPAALVVVIRGNERMVRSLNLPQLNLSMTYQPTTNAEREILARADQAQAVPLTSAPK